MKVYIAYTQGGYEGCSEPLAAFESAGLAEIYQQGSQASYGNKIEIKELEVFCLIAPPNIERKG